MPQGGDLRRRQTCDARPGEGREERHGREGRRDGSDVADQMHAIADDRIARDADLDEHAGRNALHGAGPVADHVAAARLDLNSSRTAVGPDALAGRRVGGAGPYGRPLEKRGGFAAGRSAGRQRALAVKRIGRHELRALRGAVVDACSDKENCDDRHNWSAHWEPPEPTLPNSFVTAAFRRFDGITGDSWHYRALQGRITGALQAHYRDYGGITEGLRGITGDYGGSGTGLRGLRGQHTKSPFQRDPSRPRSPCRKAIAVDLLPSFVFRAFSPVKGALKARRLLRASPLDRAEGSEEVFARDRRRGASAGVPHP